MTSEDAEGVALSSSDDVVRARRLIRDIAVEMGFGLVDQTRLVTAVSELARNTVVHGGGGAMRVERLVDGRKLGVRIAFVDEGPGIPDLDRALQDGWTSGGGLGLGLGGSRRLMHAFDVATEPGAGTTVTVVRWR